MIYQYIPHKPINHFINLIRDERIKMMSIINKGITDSLLYTPNGIFVVMLLCFSGSFLLLKLKDILLGPDLGTDYNKHKVDFDRKILNGQESNLRQLRNNESMKQN